ncbi:MAG: hypothetical protein V4695_05155 [Pseudomonadota bacterium]
MKQILARLSRRLIRAQLARTSPPSLLKLGGNKALRCFQRAAAQSNAYRTLLREAGVEPARIRTLADFTTHCPLLEKANTFRRFDIGELLAKDLRPEQIASILTSSGHGANGYALGLSTRAQMISLPAMIDLGLDMAFDTDRHRTLLINCLPMGVTFQSNAVCVANVSVREDMACAIVEQAGKLFDQIILCGDPLFLKRLCDYSSAKGIDWRRHRVNVVIGEETFSESFRAYLAAVIGIDLEDNTGGIIGSSMGVGELGLNLFNETRETIAIRRACSRSSTLLAALCGKDATNRPLPTFLGFNPLRTFVEIIAPDLDGIGDLVITVLDLEAPVPLMRYRTGDRASLIDHQSFLACISAGTLDCAPPALPVIALHGRTKDVLPDGWHVDMFKSALYLKPDTARHLSGAFRVAIDAGRISWKVQHALDAQADLLHTAEVLKDNVLSMHGSHNLALDVTCFDYPRFPYGQSIDYERKFSYWLE